MKHSLCIIFLCVFSTACATLAPQRDATENFGLATERVGKMGEAEFVVIRNGIIRMNKYQVVLDSSATSRDIRYDEPADAQSVARSLSACKSLRYYGELLMRLASDDRGQFVRRSAIIFMDSVRETLGKDLTAAQEKSIDNVIREMASPWTQSRKSRSIRDVVLAYESAVNDMADRLLAELAPGGSGCLAAYEKTALGLQKSAGSVIDAGDARDLEARKKAVEGYFVAESARIRAKQIGARIQMAIHTLKIANAEVAAGVQGRGYNLEDIKEYGRQIQTIGNMQQVITE